MLTLVKMADDLVDLWDVTVGSWPEDSGTSRYYPEGHERPWAHRMREATAKPVVAVGRYSSPDLMAEVIGSGAVDLIGSARQAIADPFLPRKIAEGRLDEIRECTGSNMCILREETFNQIGCVQNATAGEEYRRGWHPDPFAAPADPGRPVLIVGAAGSPTCSWWRPSRPSAGGWPGPGGCPPSATGGASSTGARSSSASCPG